ncbi:hypothetical protein [Arthrobacter cavernae]|uniref:Uncharacterized protein n=1 Tax=Arthrobacter cavernae TaxID=2817681 RepID=A0A939HDG3_9MICC|nr:hypothetical protein [Arthrobacter cavernae]MBO1268839.1 hypothetical protein [Arthrobacter cavernae]
MGNSGKLAVVAAVVSVGLLALTAAVLEEALLYLFLASLLTCYLASVVQVFNRRRYLTVVAGAAGTSLFIGFSIAFLRMWGLAFNQDADAFGTAVSSRDSDIYFYLAVVAGCGTLLLLFAGAVLPGRSARTTAVRRPATSPKRPPARTAQRPAPRTAASAAKRPVQRKPTAPAKRPASGSVQRKAAPKR